MKGAEERLRYYADRFDTVEANSTYYSLPAEADGPALARADARGVRDARQGLRGDDAAPGQSRAATARPARGRAVDERGRVDRPPREFRAEVFRRFHEALEPLRRERASSAGS